MGYSTFPYDCNPYSLTNPIRLFPKRSRGVQTMKNPHGPTHPSEALPLTGATGSCASAGVTWLGGGALPWGGRGAWPLGRRAGTYARGIAAAARDAAVTCSPNKLLRALLTEPLELCMTP